MPVAQLLVVRHRGGVFVTSAFVFAVFAQFGIVLEWREIFADGREFGRITKLPRIADAAFGFGRFIVRLEVMMLVGG